jgi:thiamine biosynthesis lipoprotein
VNDLVARLRKLCWAALAVALALSAACEAKSKAAAGQAATRASADARAKASADSRAPRAAFVPERVERKDTAMGTSLHFIAYTSERADRARSEAAIDAAIAEMRRLEARLSEWKDDSDVGRVNLGAGEWISVGPETLDVIDKALWTGRASKGTFDITFQVMSDLWKFGSAQDREPKPPARAEVERRRKLIDYRKVELDRAGQRVRVAKGRKIGLGGIAKGYIVDRAAAVLKQAGLSSFLVQAGGDLYGSGQKPDGSPWVSGIQDPRAPQGTFFATLELTDHAFSTAGDYARSYVVGNKRYHHIIDPRTGYPATASRSVTVWANDATTADMIDDAVFILGPEQGLALAESIDGVGVVIVDAKNKVWTSARLHGKITLLNEPTDGI